jgi:D-lactate dehydrogenase
VAEHALALILTLNRKTHKAYNRVREGNFSLNRLTGFDLHGKTIGVVGTGKIGAVFCKIIKAFGCEVLAYDVIENNEVKELGVKYVDLDELLGKSHVISLHCPLNEGTKNMINEKSIEKMKDGVMLINTSRGALVDTRAVIVGLKNRKIGYLGIDVYEQEEDLFFYDHSEKLLDDEVLLRLMSFPNVLVTSHQAFFTEEALEAIARVTLENVDAFGKGEKNKNVVE